MPQEKKSGRHRSPSWFADALTRRWKAQSRSSGFKTVRPTENILLMAHGLGLGGVWTALYPLKERYEGMQQLLHLPKTMIPLNALIIGYPKNQAEAKDKWKEENVSYNKWMEKKS